MTLVELVRKQIGAEGPQLSARESESYIDRELDIMPQSELLRRISDATGPTRSPKPQNIAMKSMTWWTSDTGDLCSDTIVGRYLIEMSRPGSFRLDAPGMCLGNHGSVDAAKVAAHDDCAARILPLVGLVPADGHAPLAQSEARLSGYSDRRVFDMLDQGDTMRRTLEIIALNHAGTAAGDVARDTLVTLEIWKPHEDIPAHLDDEASADFSPGPR